MWLFDKFSKTLPANACRRCAYSLGIHIRIEYIALHINFL
ncbi:hypothetical protein SAMN05421736_105213 [Evansella caseinilytica]|uniref:Uncharacterized protein n=1 Tax=Evansella caseinilytica TaxID=1503961 RepID=A0A1H3PTW6_9BACI|nr:hypothetical protein SAMN05421736_105213 [Evansella caseinilytica]